MSSSSSSPEAMQTRWTAALHRLAAFGYNKDDDNNNDDVAGGFGDVLTAEAVVALERAADEAAAATTTTATLASAVSDECMSLCADLLDTLPPSSPAMRALTAFVASICLAEDVRHKAVMYGVPATCVLLLRLHTHMPSTTLYHVLDLASTLAATSATARAQLRPCIPGVVRIVQHTQQALSSPATVLRRRVDEHKACARLLLSSSVAGDVQALELLFACCCVLSIMAMLDDNNCALIAQCHGVQALVDTYRSVHGVLQATQQSSSSNGGSVCGGGGGTREEQHRVQRVCADVLRWSKDTLLKLCHATSPQVRDALTTADYGVYGACIAVDELKWAITFECRRVTR